MYDDSYCCTICCYFHKQIYEDSFHTDDTLDVTSEPDEQNLAISSSSSLTQAKTQQAQAHMPFKIGQMEVELGGSVTLQCPQGNLESQNFYFKNI